MIMIHFSKITALFFTAMMIFGLLAMNATMVKATPYSNDYRLISTQAASSATGSFQASYDVQYPKVSAISPEEEALVGLLNQERAKAGLMELEIDATLVKLAREKSRDMVVHNYFGHYSSHLGTLFEQLEREAVPSGMAAENLAGAPNIDKAHLYIMRSPVHRSHVLNPYFRKIGIGVVQGGPCGKMITQIFWGD